MRDTANRLGTVRIVGWWRILAAGVALVLAAGAGEAATLLYYNFGNNGGDVVTDLSGNGRHGTVSGFASTNANAGVFGVSEGWVSGGGLSFLDDGVAQSYVDSPLTRNGLQANGSFTMEFTASAANPSGWTPAIFGGGAVFIGIDMSGPGMHINLDWEPGTVGSIPWTLPASSEEIHHVAIVYTKDPVNPGGNVELFIDGTSSYSYTRTSNMGGSENTLKIGANTGNANESWDGIVYKVAFSDQALAPSTFVLRTASLALSSLRVAENQSAGTTVGTLSTLGDTGPFTYSLVSGTGDTGNAAFQIDGTSLKTAARFDFEAQNSYSIRVCSVGATTITNVFTIAVTNLVEEYMMMAGANVEVGSAAVGTVRTSGDSATAAYLISGGTDSNMFEWAAAGSPVLQLKTATARGDLGRKYYVEVTATNSQAGVVKLLIEATVVAEGTPRGGTVIILR